MKTCLMITRTGRIAGAENIILSLANGLRSDYHIDLAVPSHFASEPLGEKIGAVSWRQLCFGKYDLIHSHLFLPGLLVGVRRIFDRKFIWVHTLHYCNYKSQKWGTLKAFFDRHFVFARVDRLVTVSAAVHEFAGHFASAQLIANAIALKSKTTAQTIRPLTIGTVAMLRKEKGIDDLLLAMADLKIEFPELILRIAGDGPELHSLQKQAAGLGLSDQVEFLGYVVDTDSFYRSLDVFVLASHTESFAMALLEAMQFSLPLVAAEVGAIPSILQSGMFGRLVPRAGNFANALSRAVSEVLRNREPWSQRAGDGLRFHAPKQSPERMCSEYLKLYSDLLRTGICMVSPVVTHAMGGLQRQLLLQSRALHGLGYRIFILQREDATLVQSKTDWSHAELLSTPNLFGEMRKDGFFAQRVRGLAFIIFGFLQIAKRRRQIHIIHAHQLFSPTLLGALVKKAFGMSLVVKVTASGAFGEALELEKLPFLALRRRAFRLIDRVIVLTSEMYSEMLKLGFEPRRLILIPNSVYQPTQTRSDATFVSPPEHEMQILYCGRLSEEKCLDTLIEAAAILARRGLRCRVLLVGGVYGGRESTVTLKELAAKYASIVSVDFFGPQANVQQFYLGADVFVLPSKSEGMSNALLEALSYGLPCVASDIEANRFVIENEVNGLLYFQGDAVDLARQLERIWHDQNGSGELSANLAGQAKELVKQRFSTASIGGKLAHLYEQVL